MRPGTIHHRGVLKGVVLPWNGFMDLFSNPTRAMVKEPEKPPDILDFVWQFDIFSVATPIFFPLVTVARPATDLHTLTLLRWSWELY